MMTNSFPQNASLGAILHNRALNSSQTRLLLDIALGAAVALASWWFQPKIWIVLVSAALVFFFYGLWAVAERELESQGDGIAPMAEYPLATLRIVGALGGLASALVFGFSLISNAFGTWIS